MHLTSADRDRITGSLTTVREPDRPDVAAQADPQVVRTVSAMLSDIEQQGLPAVRRYAEQRGPGEAFATWAHRAPEEALT